MPRQSPTLFRLTPTHRWRASIDVAADRRARQPVSRLLYGKFCEHLGSNIYNGMWAQVLRNPGFEPWHFFGRDDDRIAGAVAHEERKLGVRGLGVGRGRGVAFYWVPCGQGETGFALDADAFNSETSQRITVARVPEGASAGIAQPLYLPVHRLRAYHFAVVAKGTPDAGALLVALRRRSPDGPVLIRKALRPIRSTWHRHRLKLVVPEGGLARGELACLTLTLSRPGTVWLDQAELVPADHVCGFDPDVVRLYREARLPLLRYPGGNFSSGYHWQDGVGPRDERPTRFDRAWNTIEPNHVGTDEFMAFCRAVGCEPLLCVNAGDGTPEEAAAWVDYCNGSAESRYGRLRAQNGHPEPYGVRLWEVGNEIYGGWQIGHCDRNEYADRYGRFHRAMKAADPTIHLIACGHGLEWNEPLVREQGHLVESVSKHTLIGGGLRQTSDAAAAFESLMAYPSAYAGFLEDHRRQMAPHVAVPRLAITELMIHIHALHLPGNQNLSEALFLAGILHAAIRSGGLVELVTHTATVNHGGGLRKEREIVYPNPVYFTSKLYATQPGAWPVGIHVTTPTVSFTRHHGLPGVRTAPCLDAIALLSEAGDRLVVLAVNRHPDRAIPARLRVTGFPFERLVRVQTLGGQGPLDRNTWQEPARVKLEEQSRTLDPRRATFAFEPCSITALTFVRTTDPSE